MPAFAVLRTEQDAADDYITRLRGHVVDPRVGQFGGIVIHSLPAVVKAHNPNLTVKEYANFLGSIREWVVIPVDASLLPQEAPEPAEVVDDLADLGGAEDGGSGDPLEDAQALRIIIKELRERDGSPSIDLRKATVEDMQAYVNEHGIQ